MLSLLNARFGALHISSNVAKTRLTPTSTRTLFVAARPRTAIPTHARTFLSSSAAESPVKKTQSDDTSEKPKKTPGRPKTTSTAPKASKSKVAKKPAKAKQVEKVQLPELPPAAPGLYIYWFTKYFLPKHGRMGKVTEAASVASAEYKSLTEAEKSQIKAEWEPLYKEAMEKRNAFIQSLSPATLRAMNNERRKKGKNNISIPTDKRRPVTSYILFLEEIRPTLSDLSVVEIAHEAGKRWRAMSESEKKPYHDAAKTALEEFYTKHNMERRRGAKSG